MQYKAKIKNPTQLGLVLQQARLSKQMSQRELASKLGVSQRWISEMEQGKPGLLMTRLFEMLDSTGVELHAKFEDKSKRNL